jgi:hypothetical protein
MITLRTDTGKEFSFNFTQRLKRAAKQWRSIVRDRRRWVDSDQSRKEQEARSRRLLNNLIMGVEDETEVDTISQLADAAVVEVSIPYITEDFGWEARIMPWEYLLTAATKQDRGGRMMTVIRQLRRDGASSTKTPKRVLFVESAPGKLREAYSFEAERNLVKSCLGLDTIESIDETPETLREHIESYHPDTIHLTGVDTQQGAILGVLKSPEELEDGYLMQRGDRKVEEVKAPRLAQLLIANAHPPSLIAYNVYNSAADLCSLGVAMGAGAAIGFQDVFDDGLAELFFGSFYRKWRESKWDLLDAFTFACQVLRDQPQGLSGTGVVLWSANSLLRPGVKKRPTKAIITAPPVAKKEPDWDEARVERENINIRDLLTVTVVANEKINYSMLHNDCPLFKDLRIAKALPGAVRGIEVDVKLYVGEQLVSYTTSVDM